MATKKDFTQADKSRYSGIIGGMDTEDTKNTENIENTENTKTTNRGRRTYHRLDPREQPPREYKFTARMPGRFGQFLNELAYQRRSTITAEIQRLVKEEMDKHPEILQGLDELNQ